MSDINNLRNKMDAVTLEMINLLKTRTDIAKEIGEVKKNIGKGVTDEEREAVYYTHLTLPTSDSV